MGQRGFFAHRHPASGLLRIPRWWTPGFFQSARARSSTAAARPAGGQPGDASTGALHVAPKGAPAVAAGGLIGRLEIPRLLLSAVVVEGLDKTTLRRGVGHIPGTALPGSEATWAWPGTGTRSFVR